MFATLLLTLLLGAGHGACSDVRAYLVHACCEQDSRSTALLAHFNLSGDNASLSISSARVGNVSSCEGYGSRAMNLEDVPDEGGTPFGHTTSLELRDFLSMAVLKEENDKVYHFDLCSSAIKLWNIVRGGRIRPQVLAECIPTRSAIGFQVSMTMRNSDTFKASWRIIPRAKHLRRYKRSSPIEECMALSGFQITPPTGDVMLLLGMTGAGKTTFAYYIARDSTKLVSKEVGEGQFIILDEDGKIGSSTVSRTLVPELVVDKEYSANVYDCPGFADTRGTCADVASAYLIRKVVDKAKRVKIIFVVNYSSVQIGVDRKDFVHLTEHATKLIKNVTTFKDSVALVISKVPITMKKYAGVYKVVPDEAVKENVVHFLKNVSNTLTDHGKTEAVELIKIFVTKQGNDFPMIGLFKRPDEEGKLINIASVQENKKDLQKVLYANTNYTYLNKGDLRYSIAEESKLKIQSMVKIINYNMSLAVHRIVQDIIEFFRTKLSETDSIHDINETLWGDIPKIASIRTDLLQKLNPFEFAEELLKKVKGINPNANMNDFNSFKEESNKWQYFQDVVDEKLQADSQLWLSSFSDLELYMNSTLKWYAYLNQLYDRLSEYDVQKDTATFIRNSGLPVNLTDVTADKVREFVEKTKSIGLYNSYEIMNIVLDEPKVRSLQDVLTATLSSKIEVLCNEEGRLRVTGAYVKLSDVLRCGTITRAVHIFAVHTLFIDTDLDWTGKEVKLSLFAFRWFVVGSRKIVLDGAQGEPYEESAKDGTHSGDKGHDGRQGRSGGSGGQLLGMAVEFKNGELLTVSSNGGQGGDGQRGGRGAQGRKGRDAEKPNWTYGVHSSMGPFKVTTDHKHMIVATDKIVTVHGLPGGAGGDGGHGGKGGRGGRPGVIKIIELDQTSGIKTSAAVGRMGNAGSGGYGGEGGRSGDNVDASCGIIYFIPVACWSNAFWYSTYDYASSGSQGRAGGSNIPAPAEGSSRIFEGDIESLNSMKRFMLQFSPNKASRFTYMRLLGMLNKRSSLR